MARAHEEKDEHKQREKNTAQDLLARRFH